MRNRNDVTSLLTLPLALASLAPADADAAVLPGDRADALYHRYDGGGVTVDGPSLLVRKNFGENFSVAANYYVDMVSSASIDVLTQASPYKETRRQASLAVDMLITLGAVRSGMRYHPSRRAISRSRGVGSRQTSIKEAGERLIPEFYIKAALPAAAVQPEDPWSRVIE